MAAFTTGELAIEPRNEIVAAGPPEEIVKEKRSYTGAFLKPVLARRVVTKRKNGGAVEAAE